jgi:hypothetical protein
MTNTIYEKQYERQVIESELRMVNSYLLKSNYHADYSYFERLKKQLEYLKKEKKEGEK